jgi:hypothetical protein
MIKELKKLSIAMENANSFKEMMDSIDELIRDRKLFNDHPQTHETAHLATVTGDSYSGTHSPYMPNNTFRAFTTGNTLATEMRGPFTSSLYSANSIDPVRELREEMALLKRELAELKKKADNTDRAELKEHRKLEVL